MRSNSTILSSTRSLPSISVGASFQLAENLAACWYRWQPLVSALLCVLWERFLIGRFADSAGRKPAMILTVVLITVGTLGLAVTPGYSAIGTAAPVIVVICRLVQGFALGGEVGPSTAFLIEAAPAHRRGFYASWQLASQGIAVTAGGLIGVAVSLSLTTLQLASWGWRIPFLFSLLLVPVATYIRRNIPETLEHDPGVVAGRRERSRLSGNLRFVVLGTLVLLAGAVSSQVGNYMTTYAIQVLKLSPTLAQTSVLIGGR